MLTHRDYFVALLIKTAQRISLYHLRAIAATAVLIPLFLAVSSSRVMAGPMQSAQEFISFGNKALSKGDWDEAEKEFRYAVDYCRRHHYNMLAESYAHLAEVYLDTGRVTRAEETLAIAKRIDPEEPNAQRIQNTLTADPTLSGVQKRIQAQVQQDPKNAEAKAILASLLLRGEKYDEAKAQAVAALQLDSNEEHAMAILGQLLVRDGKDVEARQLFEKALRRDKENDHLFGSLGEIALRQKDGTAAVQYLKKATELAPEHRRWHELLADSYTLINDQEHAAAERQMLARGTH